MNFARQMLIVLMLGLLTPLAAFASERTTRSIDLGDPVQVGSTHLKPGDYKVEWQGNGPTVNVSFLNNGKTVATVPATLKTNDSKVTQDDVITKTTSANTKKLEEIDFLHNKEVLIFGQSAASGMSHR